MDCISALADVIRKDADFDIIAELLQTMEIEDVLSTQNGKMDPLQQAIILGNVNISRYLLMHNLFDNHQPQCNDYLHLSCKIGHPQIVKAVLEARPQDISRPGRVCYPNKCFHTTGILQKDDATLGLGLTPVDIAVNSQQISCLGVLLQNISFSLPKGNQMAPATLLCSLNKPTALQLLLTSGIEYQDLKAAFYQCLLKKSDCCIDVLLKYGYKETTIRKMNAYHIMYQYSSGFKEHTNRHSGLAATTAILIKNGISVLDYMPPGSYCLYSLLELIMKDVSVYGEEYLSDQVPRELFGCLKQLLKQGCRTDVDETNLICKEDESVFGRELYSSAISVIFSNAKSVCANIAASEIMRECVGILLQYGAGAKLVSSNLTGCLELLARSRKSKAVSHKLLEMLHALIQSGVNMSKPIPEVYGVNDRYHTVFLLNQYVRALCRGQFGGMAQTLNDLPAIRWLTCHMTYNCMCTAHQINSHILSQNGFDSFTPRLVQFLTKPAMMSLKCLSARAVWFRIGRQKERLSYLHLPKYIENSIVNIINQG